MATEAAQLPHLESFNRVLGLPVIEMALSKSAETYSRVRDSHQLVHWALHTAEGSLSTATRQAMLIAAPIAKKLENPIQFVDHTLCLGLDKIEEKVPMVKEKPEEILENAYVLALQTVQPALRGIYLVNYLILAQAESLRDISWNKANQILSSHYGNVAVKGLDSTAVVVDKLIDKYFPATEEEHAFVVNPDEQDKLLHTLQTVGRLSNKAARRVYANVVHHLRTLGKDNWRTYIGWLVEFLRVTRYLHTATEKMEAHANSVPPEEPSQGKEEAKEKSGKTEKED